MTREEAKKYDFTIPNKQWNDYINHIDNIYDYFENRNCINCKYLNQDNGKSHNSCSFLDVDISFDMCETFNCSEFKNK